MAETHFFRWGGGAKPSKFPTELLNFRQTPPPPFALEKAVFSPLIGQNFRKFVIFHEGGGGGGARPPHRDFRHWRAPLAATCHGAQLWWEGQGGSV